MQDHEVAVHYYGKKQTNTDLRSLLPG